MSHCQTTSDGRRACGYLLRDIDSLADEILETLEEMKQKKEKRLKRRRVAPAMEERHAETSGSVILPHYKPGQYDPFTMTWIGYDKGKPNQSNF